MSLLGKFPEEDYGMTEHMKKIEESKKIDKLNKKNKKEQNISLEIFYHFEGSSINKNNNEVKKQKKTIDELGNNLDIYNAIMNNNNNRGYRNINNDLGEF